MKCMNLVSALRVCPQSLLGEVEMEIEMQVYTKLWYRKEEAHNCLERFLKPVSKRQYLLNFGIVTLWIADRKLSHQSLHLSSAWERKGLIIWEPTKTGIQMLSLSKWSTEKPHFTGTLAFFKHLWNALCGNAFWAYSTFFRKLLSSGTSHSFSELIFGNSQKSFWMQI